MLIGSSGDEPKNELEYSQTPVSDHLKGEDLIVVYENQTEDVFFEKRFRKQHSFWQKIYLQFVTNTCSSMLSLEVYSE